jgi:hypothetical protein
MGEVAKREIDKVRERGSLDRLIDNALIHYESQSLVKKEDEDALMEWALKTSCLAPLLEANDDKNAGGEADPSPATGEMTLNPEEFASNIAMLHMNHERLMDIPTAIANRAFLYVLKNYDKLTAERFREILSSKFRIHLDPKDKPQAPEFMGLVGKGGGGGA